MSLAAYKRTIREVENPRDIERRVLTRITHDLEKHATTYDGADSSAARLNALAGELGHALVENQRLWSVLKHDLSDNTNSLPPELRASLISLALWVDRQTNLVVGGNGRIEPLIAINRSIVSGLSGSDAPTLERV